MKALKKTFGLPPGMVSCALFALGIFFSYNEVAAAKTAVPANNKAAEKKGVAPKSRKGLINKITFVQSGAYRFTNGQLNANIMSRAGGEFKRIQLNEDIKRLYKM